MEPDVRVVSPESLMGPLPDLLEEGAVVPLVISGGSMNPFLVSGRDTVYLSKPDGPAKRGDMVLYRRKGGAYVLHRVLRRENGTYTMIGDAQTHPEPGIRPEQILARVTAVRRKGKLLQKGSFWWDFFAVLWIRMVPFRPGVVKAYTCLKRPFGQKESYESK